MDRNLEGILFLLIISSIGLTLAAYLFGVFPFDLDVALLLRHEDIPGLTIIMNAVSFPGDWWIPVMMVGAVAAVCAIRKKWIEAIFVIATLSSSVIAGVLKMLIGRPRPPGLSMDPYALFESFNQYAYPSGHVLFFVVFFGFLVFLAHKYFAGTERVITISFFITLVLLIGPSRLYLGQHWLSDVVGSYIIGTFWLLILIMIYKQVLSEKTVDMVNNI